MKKIFALLLLASVSMTGCSLIVTEINEEIRDVQEEINEFEKEIEKTVNDVQDIYIPDTITESQLLDAVMPHINAYNGIVNDSFCTEADFSAEYYGAYPEALFADNDYPRLDEDDGMIFVSDPGNIPEGYRMDPSHTRYTPVTNFSSEDQLEDYYEKFMEEEIYEEIMDYRFEEIDGKLYMVSHEMGYGAMCLDIESAQVVAKNSNSFSVKLDELLFEEKYGDYRTLNFVKIPDGYRLVSVQTSWVADYGTVE